MAELWSDYADMLITNASKQMGNKYKMSLKDLISSPSKYSSQENIEVTISNMKEDFGKYVETIKQSMKDDATTLDDSLSKAEAVTSTINQTLSSLTKQNKVPLTKPVVVERDDTKEERIYVDTADNSTLSLIEKLVNSSFFIADFSTTYREKKVGEWLFSGPKNYTVRVYVPRNPVMLLETGAAEVDTLLDNTATFIKG